MHRQDNTSSGGGAAAATTTSATSATSGNRGFITTAEVLDRTMDQCMQRGLFDTASWLGQLTLDAGESVLREIISAASPVFTAVQDPPLTGRAHRHHVVALGLMQRGEYLRCHHHLSNVLQECKVAAATTTSTASTATATAAGGEDERDEIHTRDHLLLPSRSGGGGGGGGWSTPHEQHQQILSPPVPPQLQFLCLYSLYMGGECIKSTSSNPRKSANPHLRMLRGLLLGALEQPQSAIYNRYSTTTTTTRPLGKPTTQSSPTLATGGASSYGDPFLCWLHGVVLRELGMKQESATYFLAALCNHPMLWCAWEDLCTLVSRENQIEEIEAMIASLEPRFMSEIFLASVKAALNVAPLAFVPPPSAVAAAAATGKRSTSPHYNSGLSPQPRPSFEHHQQPLRRRGGGGGCSSGGGGGDGGGSSSSASPRLVNLWEVLLEQFPNNFFLLSKLAGYYYNVKKDLEKAHGLYKRLHEADPYRLESMDDYSIVLFLRGDRVGLSSLAQQVYHVDPFRAESNYVVGNYYVLMGAHDRGVLHFRRAVAADPTFIAAWTLLGHAYLETKNSAAAVEAYRTAVDLDQRDYRGWYNLGQIYELLQFYHHALYYYWHTTTLRPTDPRMWSAVANCLDREGRTGEAMLCLERAEAYESQASDFYPPLVRRLGMHYLGTRQIERAVAYLEKLTNSEAKKREDVLLAVPHIVSYYLQQAKQLLDVPSRSPSCSPPPLFAATTGSGGGPSMSTTTTRTTAGGGGVGGSKGGSLADQWLAGDASVRRNIDARWEQAAVCLATSEGHLDSFAGVLGFPSAIAAAENAMNKSTDYSASASGGGGVELDEGRSRHLAQLARHYCELKAILNYLTSQQQQVEVVMRAEQEVDGAERTRREG